MKLHRNVAPRRQWLPAGLLAVATVAGTGVALALVAVGPAANASTTKVTASKMKVTVKEAKVATYGEILEDQSGLPLYYDTANKPSHWACTGSCLTYWPPLVLPKGQAKAVTGMGVTGLTVVKGPSGRQVAWDGKPLYTFASDKAGHVGGQGIGKVWYVAQLKAATKSAGAVTTTTASGGWG